MESLQLSMDDGNGNRIANGEIIPQYYNPFVIANSIMKEYNFVGVTERMEESIVVLQLLLGLTTGDVLFLNSKGNGGFDDKCVYIIPSYVSPTMNKYFETSTQWKNIAYIDTLLHKAANRSLDLTIDNVIGRSKFQVALTKYQNAMNVVRTRCLPNVQFPCTSSGEPIEQPNCFWGDSGCGTSCIDEIADELNLYDG